MENSESLTVIIIAHNNREELPLCIRTIREFGGSADIQVLVVDNASEDGTGEWLAKQEDVAYASTEGRLTGYGEALNEAIELFHVQGDILLLKPEYALTPGCMDRMRAALYAGADTGAVGPVFNGCEYGVSAGKVKSFDEAAKLSAESAGTTDKRMIGLHSDIVMLRHDAVSRTGSFEEQLVSDKLVVRDYLLRLMEAGFHIKCVTGAVAYNMNPEKKVSGYEELVNRSGEAGRMKEKWGMNYFNILFNPNLLQMITHGPDSPIEVLEVGCDCGATLAEIKNEYPNSGVYGYEINPQAARIASCVAEVEVGNIEEKKLPFTKEKFDYIIFGDVLEHLHDPGETVRYCLEYLKPGGCIIGSIPNLMHVSVIRELLGGNFTYHDTGLLDKTHIHMFTYNEIIRMFTANGYEMDLVASSKLVHDWQKEYIDRLLELDDRAERFMYETYQYVVRARKRESGYGNE